MIDKLLKKYIVFLEEAEGLSEKTIDSKLGSLDIFLRLYKGDLKKLSPQKLIKLKTDLRDFEPQGKAINLKRVRRILNDVSKFLTWLSFQPGFKSKIQHDMISYLSLSKEEKALTMISAIREFPLLEQVVQWCEMIKIVNIIDLRDIAIIAFSMCFSLRNAATRSMLLGSIDRISLELKQSPLDGVKTKLTKEIHTFCFRFHPRLVYYIKDWIDTLYKLGYSQSDPLFPKSKLKLDANGNFAERTEIEPDFMKSSSTLNNMLKRRAEQCGVRYYSSHCLKHSCAYHALRCVEDAHQLKAVSQQFGHKTIALVLTTYGNLSIHQQREAIESMNFENKNKFKF